MKKYDVLILGAGSAGLTAFAKLKHHFKRVGIIQDGPYGTTCARVGCMPMGLDTSESRTLALLGSTLLTATLDRLDCLPADERTGRDPLSISSHPDLDPRRCCSWCVWQSQLHLHLVFFLFEIRPI